MMAFTIALVCWLIGVIGGFVAIARNNFALFLGSMVLMVGAFVIVPENSKREPRPCTCVEQPKEVEQ